MAMIGLQSKARPLPGTIEHYWFENANIGLARTVFHRIRIPFAPFDSGLDDVEQPEKTELVVEWIDLGLDDPSALDGIEISMDETPDIEASIYLGSAHNPYEIESMTIARSGKHYVITGAGIVAFEHEGVAEDERFTFNVAAEYVGGK